MAQAGNTDTLSARSLTATPGPYILQAGTVIPTALITDLRFDLPGQFSALVTTNA